jgi:hypothetical protein
MRSGFRGLALLVSAVVGLLAPATSRAELQRVEAVGIYGIRDALRTKVIPRDEAIQNAIWVGVSRVALEVIGSSAPPEPEGAESESLEDPSSADASFVDAAEEAGLRKALGKDMLPYTRSFRILEDQGEQSVLFEEKPDVTKEYVVVVEVIVDVDRVTRALEQAGRIESRTADASKEVRVELVGIRRYEAYEAFVAALRERLGVTRVRALEFSPERQVVAVQGPFEPRELQARIAKLQSSTLVLEPVGLDEAGRRIRVLGRWFPPPSETESPGRGG